MERVEEAVEKPEVPGIGVIPEEEPLKGKRHVFPDGHVTTNEILVKICQATGLHYSTVSSYLLPKFKQNRRGSKEREPRAPASHTLENMLQLSLFTF